MDSPSVSRRSFISIAKRGLASAHRRLSNLAQKVHRRHDHVQLEEPLLEAIFSKLDLDDRMRMGMMSKHSQKIVERMPLVIPFLMIRSDDRGQYELHSDNIELLVGHILQQCPGYRIVNGDKIVFNERFSYIIINRILSRISGVSQFWLDSSANGHIAQIIVDYYRQLNDSGCFKRFHIEQLTVVGTGKSMELEPIAALILLSRRHLEAARFRHCRITCDEESSKLWSAVSQCPCLKQLQYEPCRLDKFSRPHIVAALDKKKLTSLILTGVAELKPSDLFRVSGGGCLVELAVVGEFLPATVYADPKAKPTVEGLDSLLIQIDNGFSIEDVKTREALLQVLKTLPATGTLEVIHVNQGTVADTTRLLSYWLHLTRDSIRSVKLKLEGCSQERQDAAVGRLLRKSKDARKTSWSANSLTLSSGDGKVILLDKNTWFGDEV